MDDPVRQALLNAVGATERIKVGLDLALKRSAESLPEDQAAGVVEAGRAPTAALEDLTAFLSRAAAGESLPGATSAPGTEVPLLSHEKAESLLLDLQAVYSSVEEQVLKPLETQHLADDERRLLRRHVGTVWAWMISGLFDPLWRRYPDLNPNPPVEA